MIRLFGPGVAALVLLGVTLPTGALAQARFITVYQNSDELDADRILARSLGGELTEAPEALDYEAVIANLIADERKEGIVARVTPYALVVAQMRGAKVDPIATCRSRSTHRTVVNAFLVVPRSAFPQGPTRGAPTLSQVLDHLKSLSDQERPATFVYHNKLSTSSYFLPSLLFRAQKVFSKDNRTSTFPDITTITVEHYDTRSSSDLVRAVATGKADAASVWDGSKGGFDEPTDGGYKEFGSRVWFVPLPTDLPCDVLVATRRVNEDAKNKIRAKLADLTSIGEVTGAKWDVATWVLWTDREAEDAHRALSELRRQAAASLLPVVVDVRDSTTSPIGASGLDAVRLAIRLAGTELVDQSEYYDYYKRFDTRWELERMHDGAVRITARYDNFKLKGVEVTQEFEVSFLKPADLTRRVVSLIHSRLHRIRPIWLYRDTAPTVLRDVGFDVDDEVPFYEIQWNDPQRNDYRLEGEAGEARLLNSDFNFELDKAQFLTGGKLAFDPMGRQSFRVLLIRPTPERTLFRVLTVAFVLLMALAAVGLMWDGWRWYARPASV